MPKTKTPTKRAEKRGGTVPTRLAPAKTGGADAAGGDFEQGQSGSNTPGATKKRSSIRRTELKPGRPDWIDETERDTEDRIATREENGLGK